MDESTKEMVHKFVDEMVNDPTARVMFVRPPREITPPDADPKEFEPGETLFMVLAKGPIQEFEDDLKVRLEHLRDTSPAT
jgi:hypothetical protein